LKNVYGASADLSGGLFCRRVRCNVEVQVCCEASSCACSWQAPWAQFQGRLRTSLLVQFSQGTSSIVGGGVPNGKVRGLHLWERHAAVQITQCDGVHRRQTPLTSCCKHVSWQGLPQQLIRVKFPSAGCRQTAQCKSLNSRVLGGICLQKGQEGARFARMFGSSTDSIEKLVKFAITLLARHDSAQRRHVT
jgi:hypothetical protein